MATKKKPADKGAADPLALMRDRFTKALESADENRRLAVDDMKFRAATPDNGWQWPEDVSKARAADPNGARPMLTINKTRQHVNQVVNDARQNRPQMKALPVDDKADIKVAKVIDGLFRHIQTASDADIAYDTAVDCSATSGEGYFRLVTDYVDDESLDQEICFRRVRNPLTIVDDPDIQHPTGKDRKFCFVIEKYSKQEYEDRWGKKAAIDWDAAREAALSQWIGKDSVTVAEYWSYDEARETIKVGERERTVVKRKVRWQLVNGEAVIEERTWPGKWIPIMRVVGNEFDVEGQLVVDGLVRPMKDAQRMYNYHASLEVESIALAPKAPFVAPVEAIEGFEDKWTTANRVNHSYLPYNAIAEDGQSIPAPQRSMPPMPQAAIIQAKMAASDDMKSTSSQYDASLGQRSNETSGVAIAQRQREGDVATFHYIDNLSRAIKFAGEVIIDLIPYIYDTPRILRIIGEDGTPETASIQPGLGVPVQESKDDMGRVVEKVYDLTVGRYDVRVDVGPSYTTKRQEAAVQLQQMVQAQPALMGVVGDLIMKAQDGPYSQEMADRLKRTLPPQVLGEDGMEDMPPQAVGMMNAAKQAMEQMQAQMQELVQGKGGLQQQAAQIQSEQAALDAARKEFEASKAVAEANLKAAIAQEQMREMKVAQQVEAQVRDIAAREGTVAEGEAEQQQIAPMFGQMAEALAAIAQGQQALMAGLERVAAIAAAPRESVLMKDANGRPVGAVSRVTVQ